MSFFIHNLKGLVIDMNIKIVVDSSANLLSLNGASFASAALKIVTSEKEYVDDGSLDVKEMVTDLKNYKGRSSTACPGVGDFLDAFGDAQYVFCLTITATLSGSYNAACLAKREYEEMHPDRHVFVINTLSAGPEIALHAEKLVDWIKEGLSYDTICSKITSYMEHTGLFFVLESMTNLANNGRVSPVVAKAAGLLGIRAVGKASDQGDLGMLAKCRGENRALTAVVNYLKEYGYKGGRLRISHCFNEDATRRLKEMIETAFPGADIKYYLTRGLCSFYAEQGGLMIGYER